MYTVANIPIIIGRVNVINITIFAFFDVELPKKKNKLPTMYAKNAEIKR